MIGRDAELQQLRRRLERLLAGEGGIVSLVGEAGIGKSRLVQEALATSEARRAKLLVGRSLSVGRTLSYHPFADLLRGWAGVAGGADDAEALAQLDEAVRDACGDDAGEIFPFVAALMGLRPIGPAAERLAGIEGEALESLVFKSMRALLQRLAAAGPVVLFFEDLHWADRSSVQLLEKLLGLVAESPILFIHALRPDHADSDRLLGVARTHYPLQHRAIHLKPLDAAQCGELVRLLLGAGDVPATAVEGIAAKAAGSPLFVEEVVRSFADQGAIAFDGGRPRVARAIESIVVPDSVREVIAARVACLDADQRVILEVASVIGRSFFGRVIAGVLDQIADLEAGLGSLKERGLLLERRTRRTAAHARRTFVAEVEYVFAYALVQETVCDSIPSDRRRDLHARVASAIETIFSDRLADFHGMLAYHWARAENLAKAEEYLFKAGEEAARAAASSEALAFFEEASRLYLRIHGGGGDAGKKTVLERSIGLAFMNTGKLAEAMPHFDAALAHLGDPIPPSTARAALQFAGDAAAVAARLFLPRALFRASEGRTQHRDNLLVRYPRIKAQSTSDPTRLLFDYTRAVRLLNETDPKAVPEQVIGLYSGFAAMFAYSGLSFRVGRRYLAIADGLRRPEHAKDLFDHHCLVCICNYLQGTWDDESGTVSDDVIRAALRYGGLWEVNTYLGLDADRRLRRGDFAGARRRLDQLTDLAATYGFEFARSNRAGETMLLALEERRLDAALDAANLYHAVVQDDPLRVLALGSKAKAQLLLGDRAAAATTLASAREIVARAAIVPPWHLSAFAVADLLHDVAALEADEAGEDRAALALRARRSARVARRVASRVAVQRGEIYRLTANLHGLLGNSRLAARGLRRALDECERLGARPELGRAHLDAARWGLDLGDGLGRDAHLARARELFDALGLPWDGAEVETKRRAA